MKSHQSAITYAAILGLATLGCNHAVAQTEDEVNNTSAAANAATLPLKNIKISVSGELRANNQNQNPKDQDWFKIKSSDTFTSIKITITPFGIDGNERVSYQVLNAALSQVAADTVTGNPKEVVIPTPGSGDYFIKIFDDGSLTSASGNGAYLVDAVGVDPTAPPTETLEKEDNGSSAKANELFVPFTPNNTGATVLGKLRENNQTSNPRDEDWFKFTNTQKFSAFKINIFTDSIDPNDLITYQILDGNLKVLFSKDTNNSQESEEIKAPAEGAVFFVRIVDKTLTSNSAQGSYAVEVTGVGGMDTLTDDFGNPVPVFQGKPQNFSVKLSRRGRDLSDALDTRMFGSSMVKNKKGRVRSIIITNTGNSPLRRLRINRDGPNARDFSVLRYSRKPLKPGKSITVKLNFRPKGSGSRLAVLHIFSSETTDNPFDLNLFGNGVGKGKN